MLTMVKILYTTSKQTSHVIRASQNYIIPRLLLLGEHARRLSKRFPKPGLHTTTYDKVVEIRDISAPKYENYLPTTENYYSITVNLKI